MAQENREDPRMAVDLKTGNREFLVTVYLGSLKITGSTLLSVSPRATVRHSTDFLRSMPDDYLTLAQATVFCRNTQQVIDKPAYILVNVKKVDAVFAVDREQASRAA